MFLLQELGEVLLNFTNPQCGHYSSEVHHENGSFIPVSYFVKGPIEGMDVYQIWMAISSTSANCKSFLGTSELSKSRNASANQSEKVYLNTNFVYLPIKHHSKYLQVDVTKHDTNENESKESSINKEDMYVGDYMERYQVCSCVTINLA